MSKDNEQMAKDYSTTKTELNKSRLLSDEANKRLAVKSQDLLKLENANVSIIFLFPLVSSIISELSLFNDFVLFFW